MEKEDTRTLCRRCAEDYRIAGYVLVRTSDEKELCDKCERPGHIYKIKRMRK